MCMIEDYPLSVVGLKKNSTLGSFVSANGFTLKFMWVKCINPLLGSKYYSLGVGFARVRLGHKGFVKLAIKVISRPQLTSNP